MTKPRVVPQGCRILKHVQYAHGKPVGKPWYTVETLVPRFPWLYSVLFWPRSYHWVPETRKYTLEQDIYQETIRFDTWEDASSYRNDLNRALDPNRVVSKDVTHAPTADQLP